MATALVAAMPLVEGASEAVAAQRRCFAFLFAGWGYWGKPSQEGELGFCDCPLRQLRGSGQFCSPVSSTAK